MSVPSISWPVRAPNQTMNVSCLEPSIRTYSSTRREAKMQHDGVAARPAMDARGGRRHTKRPRQSVAPVGAGTEPSVRYDANL
jgi:hypothetical protein